MNRLIIGGAHWVFIVVIFGTLICSCGQRHSGASSNKPQPTYLPEEPMKVGEKTVTVEVAKDPYDRARGLMYRDAMPEEHGMLFVFDYPDYHRFYMKNTRIPLTIAFITEDGRIISLHDMEPFNEDPRHFPKEKALYALEMNQGWFERNKITAGMRVLFPQSLSKSEDDQ